MKDFLTRPHWVINIAIAGLCAFGAYLAEHRFFIMSNSILAGMNLAAGFHTFHLQKASELLTRAIHDRTAL